MYQETFVLDENLSPIEANKIIAAGQHYQNCSACLMQVYEPSCDPDSISDRMRIQRETLPKANIVGMTTLGPIGPETKVPSDPMVSLVYFEHSGFDTYLFDC
ncbi:MAG: hypothetical protein J6S36_04965, partial [Eggerthellaceae bacterium]|nr:hypothetical protein [Eggerthellaceae bacterium]